MQKQLNQFPLQNQPLSAQAASSNQATSSNRQIEILTSLIIRPASEATPPTSLPHQAAEPLQMATNAISKFKSDPEAELSLENALLEVNKAYGEFDAQCTPFMIDVRPWFPLDYAKKLHVNVITQFALYKCMHGACLFSCDSEQKWETHMAQHLKLIEVLQTKNLLNNEYRAELIKYRECAYCPFEAKKNSQLSRHMDMEHRRNTFQCTHCFYRTIEMDNMVFHMSKYHANANREILLYGTHREFQESDAETLIDGSLQYIAEIPCNLGKLTDAI